MGCENSNGAMHAVSAMKKPYMDSESHRFVRGDTGTQTVSNARQSPLIRVQEAAQRPPRVPSVLR